MIFLIRFFTVGALIESEKQSLPEMIKTLASLYTALLLVAFAFESCRPAQVPSRWELYSSDSSLRVVIKNDAKNLSVTYQVEHIRKGNVRRVLEDSPLGIIRSDGDFSKGLVFDQSEWAPIQDTYTLVSGKRRINHAHANQLTLTFHKADKARIQLVFRAYNDGVAFRYLFPNAILPYDSVSRSVSGAPPGSDSRKPNVSVQNVSVQKEVTGFELAGKGRAWMQAYDKVTQWSPAYEKYYENGIPAGTASPNASGWCFPALFEVNKLWVLLTEADLDSSYHGSHLQNSTRPGGYLIQPPDPAEAFGRPDPVRIVLPWASPWRVILISDRLATVVESNLVAHVSKPQRKGDFSWVKPGSASWSWWSQAESPRDMDALKKYIDLSARMGWAHSLVDANWNRMHNGDLAKLAAYAKGKNVNLWAWYNSGGTNNQVSEQPRDCMSGDSARKRQMQWLHSIGVKGIKVDFFQSDKSFVISQYQAILRDAATYRLMVNFHGCTIPRGWSRAWPHLLSMEAARGAETYRFARDFPWRAPLHNVHLVYTRNVIGPVDYTPVTFTDSKYAHLTSFGHELALAVALESGIVHFADKAEAYLGLPAYCRAFLSTVPVVWDQTKLLGGTPDADALIARRNGQRWYVGYINGLEQAKQVEVDFSFLPAGKYKWTLIGDGKSAHDFSFTTKVVSVGDHATIGVLPYGGFVGVLTPEKD